MKVYLSLLLTLLFVSIVSAQTAADGFQANANGSVYRVTEDSGQFYLAGQSFTQINGASRFGVARLRYDGSLDTTYDPNPNGALQGMAINGSKLIVVGGFTSIGGGPSGGIARLNYDGTNDGSFTAAIASAGPIAVQADGKVLVGGHFTTVGGQPRNRLARFNADGTLDATFTPNIDSAVFGITVQPDGKILICGQFQNVNGVQRWSFARLNPDGSNDNSFIVNAGYPGAGGSTYESVVQADGKIVIAGAFTRFGDGNVVRNYVARLNADGTPDATYTPSFDGPVYALKLQSDGKIVAGGAFQTLNGASHQRIARINRDGSRDASFGSSADNFVNDVEIGQDGTILFSGSFTTVNGTPSINRIARLYPDGRLDADTVSTVSGGLLKTIVSLPNGMALLGGGFTSVGGASRQGMARVGTNGGVDSTFGNPQFTGGMVNSIGVQPNGQYIVAGEFTSVGGSSRPYLARINSNGTLDASFAPTFNTGGWIGAVAIQQDGKILIGGNFTTVNGTTRTRFARLNASGSLDTSFGDANADFYVSCMAVQSDGKIVIGGSFEHVGGSVRGGVARLNSNGTLDTSFAPVLNGVVHELLDIKIDQDGKIIIAGAFTGVNGAPMTNLARLNTDGSRDTGFFNPGLDGAVYNVAITELGSMFIGGGFENAGGVPRAKLAQVDANGIVNHSFLNTAANERVFSVAIRDDAKLLIGGYFTSVSALPRGQFAAVRYFQPPIYSLTVTPTQISWWRWWFAPQATRVVFEHSTDGSNYTTLGSATRGASVWNLNIPAPLESGFVRARAYYGDFSERGSFHEVVKHIYKPANRKSPFDFDGDGKTDLSIFRSGPGEWWYQRSSDGVVPAFQFGSATDKLVPADFTGDGKADVAFWRPSDGNWYVLRSEDGSFFGFPFGAAGDIPAPADYDGDGKADAAVFRPASATWYIKRSGDGGTTITAFGANGDKPVIADYDGDGKADIAIWRPGPGEWWIQRSSNGTTFAVQFGSTSDKPEPGDYTGDSKADVAFWRPSNGNWYVLRSEDLSFYGFQFGANGDIPVAGDYDGDGRFDAGVFRPSGATWFVNRSTAGPFIQQFGLPTDTPVPNVFVP